MADDQVGQRTGPWQGWAFTRIFSAFRVALDPKKLLLAAAGILVMFFGWWLLSVAFYAPRSVPQWADYDPGADATPEAREAAFRDLKADRNSWNLIHEMAGRPPRSGREGDIQPYHRYDAVDLAETYEEYKLLDRYLTGYTRFMQPLAFKKLDDDTYVLALDKKNYPISADAKALAALLEQKSLTAGSVVIAGTGDTAVVRVGPTPLKLKRVDELQAYLASANSLEEIRRDSRAEADPAKKKAALQALKILNPEQPLIKPVGVLRVAPWFEYRGPNPYLLVSGGIKTGGKEVAGDRNVLTWFFTEQVPVLLEPLLKLLRPVLYFFDARGGFWNRVYLVLVVLWTLATWGLFGGAITRMAAVQVARPGERVGLMESLRFAWSRFQSYLSAPLFPLLFVAFLTVFLIFFGWAVGFTWFIGDILIAGLLWPIVLIIGLIMAVVLVGLVGWPLMYATISTEGSDSFDALSRSYSYVYQAPWHYIWYALVALAYGAILVFFIGFMGSLLVYLGKWGVGQAPLPEAREPAYLFHYAPTSFGWRSLLVQGPRAEIENLVLPSGAIIQDYRLDDEYVATMSMPNHIGAILVAAWLYLIFLLVVGFGYSYFWTASTIIYLLMRWKVDDTETDEIHLEEEEIEEPFVPEPSKPAAPAGHGVTMVESPSLRTPPAGGEVPPPTPAPPSATPPPTDVAPVPPPPVDNNPPPATPPPAPPAEEQPPRQEGGA